VSLSDDNDRRVYNAVHEILGGGAIAHAVEPRSTTTEPAPVAPARSPRDRLTIACAAALSVAFLGTLVAIIVRLRDADRFRPDLAVLLTGIAIAAVLAWSRRAWNVVGLGVTVGLATEAGKAIVLRFEYSSQVPVSWQLADAALLVASGLAYANLVRQLRIHGNDMSARRRVVALSIVMALGLVAIGPVAEAPDASLSLPHFTVPLAVGSFVVAALWSVAGPWRVRAGMLLGWAIVWSAEIASRVHVLDIYRSDASLTTWSMLVVVGVIAIVLLATRETLRSRRAQMT
jgi:hypothetical protein